MARSIHVKKGFDLKLKGQAPKQMLPLKGESDTYAWIPEDFVGLVPKLSVREGDKVQVGDPILYHKNHPSVLVTAPVSGEIVAINRGEKRRILSVEIRPDATQEYRTLPVQGILDQSAEQIRETLLSSGLWTLMRQRPYDIIPSPEVMPRNIFVTAYFTAPLAPSVEYLLEGREEELRIGLRALAKLTSGKVYVGVARDCQLTLPAEVQRVEVSGPHPAGNVGVLINHIAPVNRGEVVWTLRATDVAVIGRMFATGRVDYTRRIAITGSSAAQTGYCDIIPGCKAAAIGALSASGAHTREINGDVLTGVQLTSERPFVSYNCDQITVIPEGDRTDEVLGWAMPRVNSYSRSRSYLSWLMPHKEYVLDTRLKGGQRAMIMSTDLQRVFPMNIMAEYLIKAIIAFDIDKMEQLGIYEVAPEDFALCEFVDTSKMELQHIVRQGLDLLYKEMN